MFFRGFLELPPTKPEIHKKTRKRVTFLNIFLEAGMLIRPLVGQCEKKRRFFNGFQRSLIKNIRFFRVFRCRFPRAPPPGTRQLCLIKRNNLAVAQKQNCCQSSYDDFPAAIYWMGLSLHGPGQHGEGQHGLGQHGCRHFWFPY